MSSLTRVLFGVVFPLQVFEDFLVILLFLI